MTTSQDFPDRTRREDEPAEPSQWERFGVDTATPHSARVYDYGLGGRPRTTGAASRSSAEPVRPLLK
ncbi:SAM-dependent methyltransferase [Kitasatospora aureofaciens]|uniref:SAM-dependent methyltransferase n=1 Tax=Kitasatospora aureofaciens TaxID=1894 RepID=UPI001C46ABC2|nr:SAM-dependent methyltransferase [Kitasatospora aureofaciens]MBV6698068.1 SAM-dependent methyltransferase [Kitasatospora aureofaciens]